jgi:hypothetical protein
MPDNPRTPFDSPDNPRTPFDSIEGAQEYVGMLGGAIEEARIAIQAEVVVAIKTRGAERRLEALRLVEYKLDQLRDHISSSSRILNDLRTLRRLLLSDRD